jgi:hypothetical protein
MSHSLSPTTTHCDTSLVAGTASLLYCTGLQDPEAAEYSQASFVGALTTLGCCCCSVYPPNSITSWLWLAGRGAAQAPERGKLGWLEVAAGVKATDADMLALLLLIAGLLLPVDKHAYATVGASGSLLVFGQHAYFANSSGPQVQLAWLTVHLVVQQCFDTPERPETG